MRGNGYGSRACEVAAVLSLATLAEDKLDKEIAEAERLRDQIKAERESARRVTGKRARLARIKQEIEELRRG